MLLGKYDIYFATNFAFNGVQFNGSHLPTAWTCVMFFYIKYLDISYKTVSIFVTYALL